MGSHTLQQLKRYYFDELKELFETTMKNVNTFITQDGLKIKVKSIKNSNEVHKHQLFDFLQKQKLEVPKRAAESELDHEGSKREKTNEASESVQEQPKEEEKELLQEDLQQMMMVVTRWRSLVEALQDKICVIINVWFDHTEALYNCLLAKDMLKIFDKDDLVMLWNLVKERFSLTEPTNDKERTLWVELKRISMWEISQIHGVYKRSLRFDVELALIQASVSSNKTIPKIAYELLRKNRSQYISKQTKIIECLKHLLQHNIWFNSEKLVDLNVNQKFKGGLLGIKLSHNLVLMQVTLPVLDRVELVL
ncbi:hypothetical protein Tco_0746522 [Tanacetum coccineum]